MIREGRATLDASDSIAASEDGDWYAFPKTLKRNAIMAAVCRWNDEMTGWTWRDTLTHMQIRAGFVVQRDYPEEGWWHQCGEDVPDAVPAWIVTAK